MQNTAQDPGFRFPSLQRHDGIVEFKHPSEHYYQQGYVAGIAAAQQQAYERGVLQGQQTAQAFLDNELAAIQQKAALQQQAALELLSQQFQQQLRLHDAQLAQEILLLVQSVATVVIEAELQLQPALLHQAIDRILPELGKVDVIESIQISPQDAALFDGISQIQNVPLQQDPQLGAGEVFFNGRAQLHQLDYQQRLQHALQPLRDSLNHDSL